MSKISKVLEELAKRADMGDEVARRGITAYHGTPHDFDKFSMDSIGTGEGAQAYGHGLYFAESEDVALGYRDLSLCQRRRGERLALSCSGITSLGIFSRTRQSLGLFVKC